MNHQRQRQAHCIHGEVPLAAANLLASIMTLIGTTHCRGFHALAINNRHRGLGFFASGIANLFSQGVGNSLLGSILPPAIEHLLRSLPMGETTRPHPPLTTHAKHLENGVDDRPAKMLERTTTPHPLTQHGFYDSPLCVRQIRAIFGILHQGYGSSLRCLHTWSRTLLGANCQLEDWLLTILNLFKCLPQCLAGHS